MINHASRQSPSEWKEFVVQHGFGAPLSDLAHVLGLSVEEVGRFKDSNQCVNLPAKNGFSELFSLWHGRPPEDNEWPAPRRVGSQTGYEWNGPEVSLLVTLVGQVSAKEIAEILTKRLRSTTGDPDAVRTVTAVWNMINRVGLVTNDVIGGITTSEASREIGASAPVYQAIAKGDLQATKVGRLLVISRESWNAWKAARVMEPAGYVRLATLKDALAIKSDKLSEFARLGYIPSAIRCNPYGGGTPTTKFGTWCVTREAADQMLADRQSGRPMPWHGKALPDNLKVTFKRWKARQHPESCENCRTIWGDRGAPDSYDEFSSRYPALAHGAKRHLTMVHRSDLTLPEAAKLASCPISRVRTAIDSGVLLSTQVDGRKRVSRIEMARWIARRKPTGENEKSWLSIATACKIYMLTEAEIHDFVRRGELASQVSAGGSRSGVQYVSRHGCGVLRDKIGFTEDQAAERAGVSIERLRVLLEGVDWRGTRAIPLYTLQAIIKRNQSKPGLTITEAAAALDVSVKWVEEKIAQGVVKVIKSRWSEGHVYISAPMMARLRQEQIAPRATKLGAGWMRLSNAAAEASVSTTTIIGWAEKGLLPRVAGTNGWLYHETDLRRVARRYWAKARSRRALRPSWLVSESNWRKSPDGDQRHESLISPAPARSHK